MPEIHEAKAKNNSLYKKKNKQLFTYYLLNICTPLTRIYILLKKRKHGNTAVQHDGYH